MRKDFYIVSYDIGDERRLSRIAKIMEDFGKRVQKSVFECWLNERELDMLIGVLRNEIHPREDRIRIYKLCKECRDNVCFSGIVDDYYEEPPDCEIV